MRLFDTHAHYVSGAFNADREAVVASLPEHGVTLTVCPGDDLAASRAAVELAARHRHVYAAVGVHPEECHGWSPEQLAEVRALAARPKVVAIGEIGLDYHWAENPPREVQQAAFRDQLALARELDLPVIVHDREAHADSLAIVREFPGVRGVFHCYSGSVEDAKVLVKLGWMLSFTGTITYKNARKALEVIDYLPLERVMIETDSPYLTPEPYRGRRNDSTYVHLVAEKIAQLKGLSVEEVAEATYQNGLAFFGIKE